MNCFPKLAGGGLHPALGPFHMSIITSVPWFSVPADGETIFLWFRSIDGATILPVSYPTFSLQWPKLKFQIVVRERGDGAQTRVVGIPGWRTARYEGGMRSAQFDIYELLRNWVGISNNARYQSLLNERHLRRCVVEQSGM